ncbi:hypothetical protein K439DRAFT_163118 [Ramaria rubella]|nr:hypothetical protein K439DRAFT_163118 [Ramaria rubella]
MSTDKEQALTGLLALSKTCQSALTTFKLVSLSNSSANDTTAPVDILRKDALALHRLLHTYSTHLSVSLGKPPPSFPIALVTLNSLTSQVEQLVSCTSSFPSGALRKEAVWAAKTTIQALKTLSQYFESRYRQDEPVGDEYLVKTGAVHDAVVKAENMSKDETEAIVKLWKTNGDALEDSLKDVKEMMEEKDDGEVEEDGWDELVEGIGRKLSPEEIKRVEMLYPLLRFTTLLHEKILSHHILKPLSQPHSGPHMKTLFTFSNSILVATEDILLALYPPQDGESTLEAVDLLYKVIEEFDQELGVTKADLAEESAGLGCGSKSLTWFKKCFLQIKTVYNRLLLDLK